MAKTDVKSAFRIIPIHPADYSLLGLKWDNIFYFEAFSTALEWLSIHHLGACAVLHILDDFFHSPKQGTM